MRLWENTQAMCVKHTLEVNSQAYLFRECFKLRLWCYTNFRFSEVSQLRLW